MIEFFFVYLPVALVASTPFLGHFFFRKNLSLFKYSVWFSIFILGCEVLAIGLKVSFSSRIANAVAIWVGLLCIGFIASLSSRLRPKWIGFSVSFAVSVGLVVLCTVGVVGMSAAVFASGNVYETSLSRKLICRIDQYGNATTAGGGIDVYLSRLWVAGLEQELAKARWEDGPVAITYESACNRLEADYFRVAR